MTSPDPTWDAMRARTYDLYDSSGAPATTVDALLSALGMSGKSYTEQVKALRAWQRSPAAVPAPYQLTDRVRRFVSSAD